MGIVKSRENTCDLFPVGFGRWTSMCTFPQTKKVRREKPRKVSLRMDDICFGVPCFSIFMIHVPFAHDFDIHRNGDDCWFKPHED
jgi:hypothetical protein